MTEPEDLIQAWKDFLQQKGIVQDKEGVFTEYGLNLWETDKEWTQRILGQNNINAESPLGEYLCKRYGNGQRYRYRLEEWKIDLVLAPTGDPEGLRDLWDRPTDFLQDWFQRYELVLEHENYFETSMEEMLKLTYVRAPLKVVITYDPYTIDSKKRQKDYDRSFEILKANFSKIIAQANDAFPENSETKYLLLVGSKRVEGEGKEYLIWDYEIFEGKAKVEGI